MKQVNFFITQAYQCKLTEGYEAALSKLEQAHLISQTHALTHLKVHWEMFKLALEFKVIRELWGQIPRIILAIPGSLLGMAPTGNVGSTRMGIFEKKFDSFPD